jgi:hypothetical protein
MSDLDKRIECLTERLNRLDSAFDEDRLVATLNDLAADQVGAFTSQQAADYLRNVNETEINVAYQVLSKRIDNDTLVNLCLEFLRRPEMKARRAGAFGLGSCLSGTGHTEASRALALVVRNLEEDTEIRIGAYLSLIVINKSDWVAHSESEFKPEGLNFELKHLDSSFVDRFLGC